MLLCLLACYCGVDLSKSSKIFLLQHLRDLSNWRNCLISDGQTNLFLLQIMFNLLTATIITYFFRVKSSVCACICCTSSNLCPFNLLLPILRTLTGGSRLLPRARLPQQPPHPHSRTRGLCLRPPREPVPRPRRHDGIRASPRIIPHCRQVLSPGSHWCPCQGPAINSRRTASGPRYSSSWQGYSGRHCRHRHRNNIHHNLWTY